MVKKEVAPRKRMVVEEVGADEAQKLPQEPVEELKEKVEELQTITDGILEVAEKVVPTQVSETPIVVPSPTVQEIASSDNEKVGPSPLMIILPGILLLGALLGGIFFYQKRISSTPSENTEPITEEVVATETASPTPKAELDLAKFKISVLNGGGTPGEAGKAKTLLETAGFTVSSTANAKDYSFTKTIIGAKSTVDKGFLDALSTALGKTYVVGTNETIATSSADSVVVTIGSSKK